MPLALFFAGSPAAGKTEVARALINEMARHSDHSVIHLDPDYFRQLIPSYSGERSELFQGASSRILSRCFDVVVHAKRSFIFDSTLANFKRAQDNITRCLHKGYTIRIIYVYQDALAAWKTAKARERGNGRCIPLDAFIERYFSAKQTVNELKDYFQKHIQVDLMVKDVMTNERSFKFDIAKIDNHVDEKYTADYPP